MSAMGREAQQDTASECPLPQLLGNFSQVSLERETARARLIREMLGVNTEETGLPLWKAWPYVFFLPLRLCSSYINKPCNLMGRELSPLERPWQECLQVAKVMLAATEAAVVGMARQDHLACCRGRGSPLGPTPWHRWALGHSACWAKEQ